MNARAISRFDWVSLAIVGWKTAGLKTIFNIRFGSNNTPRFRDHKSELKIQGPLIIARNISSSIIFSVIGTFILIF